MDLKAELRRELAEATLLVWKMQNALTEGEETISSEVALDELMVLAALLNQRSSRIVGYLTGWALRGPRKQDPHNHYKPGPREQDDQNRFK